MVSMLQQLSERVYCSRESILCRFHVASCKKTNSHLLGIIEVSKQSSPSMLSKQGGSNVRAYV